MTAKQMEAIKAGVSEIVKAYDQGLMWAVRISKPYQAPGDKRNIPQRTTVEDITEGSIYVFDSRAEAAEFIRLAAWVEDKHGMELTAVKVVDDSGELPKGYKP